MKKPIILHVTPSLMVGGAEKLLVDLLTNFKTNPNNQFEHQVIYFQAGPFLKQLKQLEIKTYKITGLIKYWDPICLIKLFLLIRRIRPYKIHSMLFMANLYARLVGKILKIPVICAIHSYYNNGNLAQDNLIKQKLDQLTLKWATVIIVVSAEIYQKISASIYRLKPYQIRIIHNGVKIPNLSNNKNNLDRKPDFIIGNIGRFVPVKNQALLIQALSLIKTKTENFKAIIIGSGELETDLKKLVQDLKLESQVTFIATNQPKKHIAKFDCFVLPSHQEGQSIALLETMSFGVTPIITAACDIHDIVKNNYNGLVCQPSNYLILAQAILQLMNNPKLNYKLAQKARLTIANRFDLSMTANNYLSVYKHN